MYVVGTAGHVDHGKSCLVKALTGIDPDRLPEEKARGMTTDLGFAWLRLPSGREISIIALEEIEELLVNTSLSGAPVIPISTVTGEGLADLVATLDQVLLHTAPRPDLGRPRLWIDRAFSVAGYATVVTGTLIDGMLSVGQEVEILPDGIKSRIRALETHKRRIEVARPGTRVAVNLTSLPARDLVRGDLLTIPGWLIPTKRLDVKLRCLPGSPEPLNDGASGQLYIGSADVQIKVRLLSTVALAPGETGWAQLFLDAPIAAVRGDRFVLRRPALGATVGGGVVIDPHPLRHRRFQVDAISRLETMERSKPQEILRHILGEKIPVEVSRLLQWTGLAPTELEEAIQTLSARGEAILLSGDRQGRGLSTGSYLTSLAGWQRLASRIASLLGEYHCRFPLRRTMPREELRSRLDMGPRLFRYAVSRAVAEGVIVEESVGLRLVTHRVQFTAEQEANSERLLQAHRSSPYAPPTAGRAARDYGVDAELLQALIERGDLVSVGDDVLFLPSVYEEMLNRIEDWIEQNGSITVAQVRDMFGTTRRYAMALLEHLDLEQITKRVGDVRVLRQRPNSGIDR